MIFCHFVSCEYEERSVRTNAKLLPRLTMQGCDPEILLFPPQQKGTKKKSSLLSTEYIVHQENLSQFLSTSFETFSGSGESLQAQCLHKVWHSSHTLTFRTSTVWRSDNNTWARVVQTSQREEIFFYCSRFNP